MKKLIYKPVIALFIGAMLLISSCSKKEGIHGGDPANTGTSTPSPAMESKIRTIVANLPHVKAHNDASMRQSGANRTQDAWDFSHPLDNFGYSSSTGLYYAASSNTFVLSAIGGGATGGTV